MRWMIAFVVLAAFAWWAMSASTAAPARWDAARVAALTADLVDVDGKAAPPTTLRGAKRVMVYFSAAWCGPCRAFTPQLVDFYEAKGGGEAFEVLFVSLDANADDMAAYMEHDAMPWWGVRHGSASARELVRAYAKQGIPHLVLLDGSGAVLADSYDGDRYLGPQHVLAAFK
ncbi:MAG TPA: thioredoxin-like domain-containing protein [Planctomycetota bacterium]|nr:thioredoxin-like domain-containing protein [Planctomycetota bacterium]